MTYKGYTGKVTDVDPDTGELYGEVANIFGVITFVATTGPDLVRELRASVDDYLAWAAEDGFEPAKPYSGKFQTRVPPALHKKAARAARTAGVSLNAFVQLALQAAVVDAFVPKGKAKSPAAKPVPAAARSKARGKSVSAKSSKPSA